MKNIFKNKKTKLEIVPELKSWKDISLKQNYRDSCIATGLEWIIRYNKLDMAITGYNDFQKRFNLEESNCFANIEKDLKFSLYNKDIELRRIYNHLKVKNFPTTKDGFNQRMDKISELISQDIPVLLPVLQEEIGWHIMPVIRVEKDNVWLLRRNYMGRKEVDMVKNLYLRRYFLNEDGGEDLAWIDKPEIENEKTQNTFNENKK